MENENNLENSSFNNRRFGEELEQFEIAKLRRKYEALGYEFKQNFKPRRSNFDTFYVDAYAINRATSDEIIFEIKSLYTYNKRTAQDIRKKREEYLNWYPNARFILVLAREEKPLSFQFPQLGKLLFDFISKNPQELLDLYDLKGFISIRFHDVTDEDYVTDVECTSFTYLEGSTFQFKGYANFRFWMYVEEEDFRGEVLNEGIPFFFNASVKFTNSEPMISQCKIKFDFSEFGLPNR